jgi:hypothetical protein
VLSPRQPEGSVLDDRGQHAGEEEGKGARCEDGSQRDRGHGGCSLTAEIAASGIGCANVNLVRRVLRLLPSCGRNATIMVVCYLK